VVIAVEDNTATVEVARSSACNACSEKTSCTMMDHGSNIRLQFKNAGDVSTGDIVEIAIRKNSFYKSLFTIYIMPILLMLTTAITMDKAQDNQVLTAFSTLGSAGLYFLFIKFLHKGKDKQQYTLIR
jgi:sigma-E factor negative regulatory protein RseC